MNKKKETQNRPPSPSYNSEAYDAATGMLNLRARQYEPAMNRFSQKDIVRGQVTSPLMLNRYVYCASNPLMNIDPTGLLLNNLFASVKNTLQTIVSTVKTTVSTVKTAIEATKLLNNVDIAAKNEHKEQDKDAKKDLRKEQNKAAQEAFDYFDKNYDNLSPDIKNIYDEATKKLKKKNLSPEEKNKIKRTACKLMLAKNEDKSYDRSNPITIKGTNDFGTHYSLVPYEYFVDAAFFMADNPNFVSREKGLKYNNGVWSMDCIYTQAFIAKSWMDKDIYDYYQDKGYIKLKVSYQYDKSMSTGTIDKKNPSQYPPGTGFYYDDNGDKKGDSHIGYQLGNVEYNGRVYENAMFSSPGGTYEQRLSIYELNSVEDYKLYGLSSLFVP